MEKIRFQAIGWFVDEACGIRALCLEQTVGLMSLITLERIRRLLYYLKAGQYGVAFDRVTRLLKRKPSESLSLKLYPVADIADELVFPVFDLPKVSIVIPAFNQWETTLSCLASVLDNTGGLPYEVIVADDASRDETRNIKKYVKNVIVVVNEKNLGFLRNCNRAASVAFGDYILFLNNDTNVQRGWVAELLNVMERDAAAGLVGSKLLYPNGWLQEAGGIIWKDGSGWNFGRADNPLRCQYNYLKEVDYVSGASIMIRRSLWEDIGGFDLRLSPAYYEDTDLAFEVRRRGYKVVYQPKSLVVHMEGVSHGTNIGQGVKAKQVENRAKFREKWRDILNAEHGEGVVDIFSARDRGFNRKRLLFVDHYVPLFDRDAGSRATLQYLELLVQMGYLITFMPDNFVAYQPYTERLQQMGVEVLYGAWYHWHWKRWLRENARHFDYVILSRPHVARKYIQAIRNRSQARIIYFGHDLHYVREARHHEVTGDKASLAEARRWKKVELALMDEVDAAYFFSDYEIQELRRERPDATLRQIPLFFTDGTRTASLPPPAFEDKDGLLFVGSFTHQPNVDAVMWFTREVMPRILGHLPGLVFTVVGPEAPKEVMRLVSSSVVLAGAVSDEELSVRYRRARLVVAPLRFGAGVKGKIIQAMEHDVPVVTTTIGAEGIPEAVLALSIADDADGFADSVVRLYTDAKAWDASVLGGRQVLSRHFSFTAARDVMSADMPL